MIMWESFCIFLLLIVVKCQADVCRSSCESTYPLHTTDKVGELKACLTGCRISFITQLSSSLLENQEIVPKCVQDCDDGYQQKGLSAACHVGCQSQHIHKAPQDQELESLFQLAWHRQLFHPFHHIGHYCSKMYRNAATYVISSVNMQDGSGSTLIMEVEIQPRHHHEPSQMEEKVKKDEEGGSTLKHYANLAYQHGRKWLNCVERRAGIPYWSLVGVLFLCLFFMCWVCCSTCDEEGKRLISKKHVFQDEVSVHADPIAMEKPPPYFIIAEYEAGPLPEKQPLID